MRIASLVFAAAFVLCAAAAHATTYYVSPQGDDGLDGLSRDRAWSSIRYAASQANPGDTITLLAGFYRERVNVKTPGLRFVADPPGGAVVKVIQTKDAGATDVQIVGVTFTGSLRIKASGWILLHCRLSSGGSVSFYRGSATVSNALLVGHGSTGIKSYGAAVVVENLTLNDYGTAFYVSSGSMLVRDAIIGSARRVAYTGKRADLEIHHSGFWDSELPSEHQGAGNVEGFPGWDDEFLLSPESPFVDAGSREAANTMVAGMVATWDLLPDQGRLDLGFHDPTGAGAPPPVATPTPVPTPVPPSPTPTPGGNPGEPDYFGFGSLATGGSGHDPFLVTSLADSGAGTLRRALEDAGRAGGGVVLFEVSGDIVLRTGLRVPANTTLDGLSAPPPGITLWGERVGGGGGVINIYESNTIVRGLRVRNGGNDGIQIAPKSGHSISDIVVDHCSVTNSADGGIDVTGRNGLRVTDLTLSWNYLAGSGGSCSKGLCGGASLVKYGVSNISFYANLWDKNLRRNPGINGLQIPGGTLADIRYNLVRDPKDSGMQVLSTARANVISNYFEGKFTPVWFRDGYVFATGNVATKQVNGNVSTPFDVIGEPPAASRNEVMDGAGDQPRDDIDNFYIVEAGSYEEVRANPFSP